MPRSPRCKEPKGDVSRPYGRKCFRRFIVGLSISRRRAEKDVVRGVDCLGGGIEEIWGGVGLGVVSTNFGAVSARVGARSPSVGQELGWPGGEPVVQQSFVETPVPERRLGRGGAIVCRPDRRSAEAFSLCARRNIMFLEEGAKPSAVVSANLAAVQLNACIP